MAIDFRTTGPEDWTPGLDTTAARESRAQEKHEAWRTTQATKAQDREQQLAKEAFKQDVAGAEAEADFDTFFAKEIKSFQDEQTKLAEKEKTQARKGITETREDIRFTQSQEDRARQERDRAVQSLGRRNLGFNFQAVEDMEDYVKRDASDFVNLKDAVAGDANTISKLRDNTGFNIVSSGSLAPTDAAYSSRFGIAVDADGQPVMTEKFLMLAADRNRDSGALAKSIARNMEAKRKEYLAASAGFGAEDKAPVALDAEEIKNFIDTIRREDVKAFQTARSTYDRVAPVSTESVQGKAPANVGEFGVGESFDTAPSFTGNVFAELSNLSKSPSTMFRLMRDYGKYSADVASTVAADTAAARYKAIGEAAAARTRAVNELADQLSESYVGFDSVGLSNDLLNDAKIAEAALRKLDPNLDPEVMTSLLAESDRLATERHAVTDSDRQKALADTIYAELERRVPGVTRNQLAEVGGTEILRQRTSGLQRKGTLDDAVRGAMQYYRSGVGMVSDILGGDMAVNQKFTDPLSEMQWTKTGKGWSYGLMMEGGIPALEVGPETLKEYMAQYGIKKEQDALNSLSHSARMGDLNINRGTLFAYNPHTREVDTNATLSLNPNALYDNEVFKRSVNQLRDSGAAPETIEATIKKWEETRTKSAADVVKHNLELEETLGALRDTWVGTGAGFLSGYALEALDKMVSFKDFYGKGKAAGLNDEQILANWQKEGQSTVGTVARGLQVGTHKFADTGTGAVLGGVLAVQNMFGATTGIERTRNMWNALNEKQAAGAELVKGNIAADMVGEVVNLGMQMVATAGAGRVGGLVGRGLERSAVGRLINTGAKAIARKTEALVPAARPGLVSGMSQGLARAMNRATNISLSRVGAGAGVNMVIAGQIAPQAYTDIFYSVYDREMQGKQATPEAMESAQATANLRAMVGAGVAAGASVLINNRYGMESFMRKVAGARSLRGGNLFNRLDKRIGQWRSKAWSEMGKMEKVKAVSSYLYSMGKVAAEGAAEELADETQEWAITELAKNGEISEASIATFDDVLSAATKIAILGAMGSMAGARWSGEEALRFKTEPLPQESITFRDASNIVDSTGQALEVISPDGPSAEILNAGREVIATAGDRGDAVLTAPEWVNNTINGEGLNLPDSTRKAWIDNAPVLGATNFAAFRGYVQEMSDIYMYEGETAAGEYLSDVLTNLPTTIRTPTDESIEAMRTMLTESYSGMQNREMPVTLDDDLNLMQTGDPTLDEASLAIDALTNDEQARAVAPTEPPASTEPTDAVVAAAIEKSVPLAPVEEYLATGRGETAALEVVNDMTAGIATFDPNTGAWLAKGDARERAEKLVNLAEETNPTGPIVTTNTGESIVLTPNATMYTSAPRPADVGAPRTTWGQSVSAMGLPTDGSGMNGFDLLDSLSTSATPAQRSTIEGLVMALRDAGLELTVRQSVAPDGNFSPAFITYAENAEGKMTGGIVDLFTNRENPLDNPTATLIHEGVHLLDRHYRKTSPEYADRMGKLRRAVADKFNDIHETMAEAYQNALAPEEKNAIALTMNDIAYGLRGEDEFASVLFSNPVMRALASEAAGENLEVATLTRYADTTGNARAGVFARIINALSDLFHRIRNAVFEDTGISAVMEGEEWASYVSRVADINPNAWYILEPKERYAVDNTDLTIMGSEGSEVTVGSSYNPVAYQSELSQRLSYGVSAELMGTKAGNFATMFRSGWRMTRWGESGIHVVTPEQRLVLKEQKSNLKASYQRAIDRLGKVGEVVNRTIVNQNLSPEVHKKWSRSIVDMAGNLDNDIEPEVVARINEQANADVAEAKAIRDTRVRSAKDYVARTIRENAEFIRVANRTAMDSEGLRGIGSIQSLVGRVSEPGYSETLNVEVAAPRQDESLRSELAELGRLVEAQGNNARADRFYALAEDTRNYVASMTRGEESPYTEEEIADRWVDFRSEYLRGELESIPEMADSLHNVAEAKAWARTQIKEANEEYTAATKHAGLRRDGTRTEAGIIWKKRDAAIAGARRQQYSKFMERRKAGEEFLLNQGAVGKLVYNAINDARQEIARTQVSIAHALGDDRMRNNALRMDYLHRTYLAVGEQGERYSSIMREIIQNPNGDKAKQYAGLTATLNEAATAHAQAHQQAMCTHISRILDNMQALAALHDRLKLPLVKPEAESNENYSLLFDGVPVDFRDRELLDFIHDNYSEVQLASDLKNGANILSIYDKAMSMVAQSNRYTKGRMQKELNQLNVKGMDNYLASLFPDMEGETLMQKLEAFTSGAEMARAINNVLPLVSENAVNQIWNTPGMTAEEKLNRVVSLLRGHASNQMTINGLGNVINSSDLNVLEYPMLAGLAMDHAKKAMLDVLSKKRTTENILAQRQRVPEWQRKAMHELNDATVGEAIGVLQNTLSLQSNLAVNTVLAEEVAQTFLANGAIHLEQGEGMEEIKLKHKGNAFNGKYADPEVVQSLYKVYRPADEIMNSRDEKYKGVAKYWKNNQDHIIRNLSGAINATSLITGPGSTLRNMYGTAAQMIHAGALPIKGAGEIASLVRDWAEMNALYAAAGRKGIGAEKAAEALLRAEEKYNSKIKYYQELGILDSGVGEFLRNVWKRDEFERYFAKTYETEEATEDAFYNFAADLEASRDGKVVGALKKTGKGLMAPVNLLSYAYGIPDAAAKIALFSHQQAISKRQLKVQLDRARVSEQPSAWQQELMRAADEGEASWNALVDRHAATKVKTLLPTGTRTPQWVKDMGQFVAPYFMFQYHTFQSVSYNVGYAVGEIRDGAWAMRHGDMKNGTALTLRGLARLAGSSLALTQVPGFTRWGMIQALSAWADDDKERYSFIQDGEVLRKMAEAGFFPEYDKYGDLLAVVDKDRGELLYWNLEYANPYKNVFNSMSRSFTYLYNLASAKELDKWDTDPKAELWNLGENTIFAESMLFSAMKEYWLNDEFHFRSSSAAQNTETGVPEAVANAALITLGFTPTVGSGHTYTGLERLARFINDKAPAYSWISKALGQSLKEVPDMGQGAFIAQSIGTGLRRPKDLSEAIGRGLKTAEAEYSATRRSALTRPDFYRQLESRNQESVDAMVAADYVVQDKAYARLVDAVRFADAMVKMLPKEQQGAALAGAVESSGLSKEAYRAAKAGIMRDRISKSSVKNAIEKLNREMKKAATTDEGKALIERQKALLLREARRGSSNVNDRALSQEEINQALRVK